MQRGDLNADLPAIRSVGYRQAWAALENTALSGDDDERIKAELMLTGVAATRQLAKRQITWLRSMPQRHIVYADAPDATVQAQHWFETQLAKG